MTAWKEGGYTKAKPEPDPLPWWIRAGWRIIGWWEWWTKDRPQMKRDGWVRGDDGWWRSPDKDRREGGG